MSHLSLTRYGYILKKDELTKDEIKKVKEELTVKPLVLPAFKEFAATVKPYPIFIESPQRLFIPRHYGIQRFGPPTKSNIKQGLQIKVNDTIKLKQHQLKSFDKAIQQLRDHGGGVLSLPCGWGKTIIALKIIAALGIKTLVLVNKEFLMDQWVERIEQFIPNAKIGIIQQKKFQIAGNDIVIGMIHSISKKVYPREAFDEISLVVADECHHLSAEMFSRALPKVATQYMLGLSATPHRRDGLSYVFYHYLGPLFHKERRTGNNVVIVKQVHIDSHSPHYDLKFNTIRGKQFKNTKGMIGNICKFKERDQLIIRIIREMIDQGRKILLLSERRDHLEGFMKLLKDASIRNKQNQFVTYGLYYGQAPGVNKKTHKKMLAESAKCDIVLGTCAMASEALDIPTLNTLIFVTPMTDVEQASGRILRKFHVGLNPLIIDLIDEFGNFPRHGKMREKYFKSEDYIIESYSMYLSDNPQLNIYEKTLIPYLNSIKIPIRTTPSPKNNSSKLVQSQLKSKTIIIPKIKPTSTQVVQNNPTYQQTQVAKRLPKNHPNIPKGACLLDDD